MLVEVLKNFHTREINANHAQMSDAKITLLDIVDRVPNIYNTNERWVIKNEVRVCQ
jgi:hypothetical protein